MGPFPGLSCFAGYIGNNQQGLALLILVHHSSIKKGLFIANTVLPLKSPLFSNKLNCPLLSAGN